MYYLKLIFRFTILPYTILLLYWMFLGFGRTQMEDHIVRLQPVYSTSVFLYQKYLEQQYWVIATNLLGNILMFIPFGFLGWVFPKLNDLKMLLAYFLTAIFVVEALQYFTRMGVCELDDILLNTFGVWLGFKLKKFLEQKFNYPSLEKTESKSIKGF